MINTVSIYGAFNNQTGYGIHTTNFAKALEGLGVGVFRNQPGGDFHIWLLDTVSAQHVKPANDGKPRILYNVWESTRQPKGFMDALSMYDQLWVPTHWQRDCTIEQGVPPEFVKIVPEGIDGNKYKPEHQEERFTFDFLICERWEGRKYTTEKIRAWIEEFPPGRYPSVRLYLICDNPFPTDGCTSTEERLIRLVGTTDERIIPIHFEQPEPHIQRVQKAHVFIGVTRAEGWGLPLIEAMACGIPSIFLPWSGVTEYAKLIPNQRLAVKIKGTCPPFNMVGMKDSDTPGFWAEPDFEDLKGKLNDAYWNYVSHKQDALVGSESIRDKFSWENAAQKACNILEELTPKSDNKELRSESNPETPCVPQHEVHDLKKAIWVIGCWPSSLERLNTLNETIKQIKDAGFDVLLSSHFALDHPVIEQADYYVYEKRNILSDDDFHNMYARYNQAGEYETKEVNIKRHDVACLNAIRNAIDFIRGKYETMYYTEFDLEFDVQEWVKVVTEAPSPVVMVDYEKFGVRTDFFAGKVEVLDRLIPYVSSWKEYLSFIDLEAKEPYILEAWMMKHLLKLNVGNDVMKVVWELTNRYDQVDRDAWPDDVFIYHFVDGPLLEIQGLSRREYDTVFSNPVDGIRYRCKQKVGVWAKPDLKYYRDWTISCYLNDEQKFVHKLELKDKRVLLQMGSKALGDTIAWIPYLEEFVNQHGCIPLVCSWWNRIFDYPQFEWIEPGAKLEKIYGSYTIGCFDEQPDKNPNDWRTVTLQKVSTDILGLQYKEMKPKMKSVTPYVHDKPYVCFSEHSTMKGKLWNKNGAWQEVIEYLRSFGYDCISISAEPSMLQNVIKINDPDRKPEFIFKMMEYIAGCNFYVGLNHGPAWLAWALNKPVVMINGMGGGQYGNGFATPYMAERKNVCHGCFNDTKIKIDRGWDWCPRKKSFECTRKITVPMVIAQIDKLRADLNL